MASVGPSSVTPAEAVMLALIVLLSALVFTLASHD
jgi:hypothetical protein